MSIKESWSRVKDHRRYWANLDRVLKHGRRKKAKRAKAKKEK